MFENIKVGTLVKDNGKNRYTHGEMGIVTKIWEEAAGYRYVTVNWFKSKSFYHYAIDSNLNWLEWICYG